MKIILQAKNFKLDDAITGFVHEKLADVEKVLGNADGSAVEARVEVAKTTEHHRQSDDLYRAEINLNMPGRLLRAESQNFDLYVAITEVRDEIQRQVRKYKEKKRDLSRRKSIKNNEFPF